MTEFQRAVAVVETAEVLVAKLSAGCKAEASVLTRGAPEACSLEHGFFLFDPPSRLTSNAGDDWVLIGSAGAPALRVSDEFRSHYVETAQLFEDLAPAIERIRRRCGARAELEVVRSQLSECLNAAPDDILVVAQDFISAGDDMAQEDLAPLLIKAQALERAATYGAKMAGQASDLVARFDTARALYNAEVVPCFAAAVAAAEADAAERRAAALQAEAASAELERRRDQEKERQLLAQLLQASEQGLKQSRLHAEHEAMLRAEEATWDFLPTRCGGAMAAPCARAFS